MKWTKGREMREESLDGDKLSFVICSMMSYAAYCTFHVFIRERDQEKHKLYKRSWEIMLHWKCSTLSLWNDYQMLIAFLHTEFYYLQTFNKFLFLRIVLCNLKVFMKIQYLVKNGKLYEHIREHQTWLEPHQECKTCLRIKRKTQQQVWIIKEID